MKQILTFLLSTFLLYSCGPVITERDALKKNEEGVAFMNRGKYEEALAAFKEALKNPRLSSNAKGTVYRNAGLSYHELGNSDSAIHYHTLAAKCFKKNSYDYLVNMASVDILRNKTGMALTKLKKAHNINPDDLAANNLLGLIYLGDYDEEFADPEKALPYNKKAFMLNNSHITEDILGRNFYEVGDYEMAEIHYERIHNAFPANIMYTLSTGMIKYKLKKTMEADLLFKQVLEQDSSYRETIRSFKLYN